MSDPIHHPMFTGRPAEELSSRSDAGGGRAEALNEAIDAIEALTGVDTDTLIAAREAVCDLLRSSPPVGEGVREAPAEPQACVVLTTGRLVLKVGGAFVAMEGDPCRDDRWATKYWDAASLREAAVLINGAEPQACGWQDKRNVQGLHGMKHRWPEGQDGRTSCLNGCGTTRMGRGNKGWVYVTADHRRFLQHHGVPPCTPAPPVPALAPADKEQE